jgi:diaminopimelate decarboxylase
MSSPTKQKLTQLPETAIGYEAGELTIEGVRAADIAAAVDTPAYVYSSAVLRQRGRAYVDFATGDGTGEHLACYAVKANGNPAIISLLRELGLGADVTSGGELFLAQQAAVAPSRTIYSGVGKKKPEIREALLAGIRALHVESEMELSAIAGVAEELQRVAPIGVRVNPNINAATHPYISTGLHGHKFGVPRDRAVAILRAAAGHPWLQPVGLAAHIGSQITDLEPYAESVSFLVRLADELRDEGIVLDYIDVGGGLGISYESSAPSISEWAAVVAPAVWRSGYELVMEPGRSIVGPAGVLLTRVVYTKAQGDKAFVIVDAGMTDLLRPTLYQAYHPIVPAVDPASGDLTRADVVGPICETGDWLARDRDLPPLAPGDLVAVLQAGAYGYAMSSNYNGHLRPAEVLVTGDSFEVIRRRQTYADLVAGTAFAADA